MTVWLVAAAVALLPLLLSGPAAERLARAEWAHNCPRAALAMWQAIGLAGGLSAVAIGLVAAVAPLAAAFPHGMHTFGLQILNGQGLSGLGPAHIAALVWSAGLIAWLLFNIARTIMRTTAEQRRQRLLVDVIGDPWLPHDAYLLPSAKPVAYCVPGRRARIVLSRGTLDLLNAEQVQAVLAHERAHARGRHDLLLLPFIALALAFPWVPVVRTARAAVPVLLEMLADDQARRTHDHVVLVQAIVQMAAPASQSLGVTPALADSAVLQRVDRLLHGTRNGSRWMPATAYSTAGLLLCGPLAVLVAPLLCTTIWQI